ncbi:MAG: hypothetical protein QNJ31_04895 [Candidatus Caenarcaniphilales bacterium]|nr:hypothetical protein [Candidatus Caenarcaniphilales bacterium]
MFKNSIKVSILLLALFISFQPSLGWFGEDSEEYKKQQSTRQKDLKRRKDLKERRKQRKDKRNKKKEDNDDGLFKKLRNRKKERKNKDRTSFWERDKEKKEQRKAQKEKIKLLKKENKLLKEQKKLQNQLSSQPIRLYELNKKPSLKEKITSKFFKSKYPQSNNVFYQRKY